MPALKTLDLSGAESDDQELSFDRNKSLDAQISDRGIAQLASTMNSGCMSRLSRLLLHTQPAISSAGFVHLKDTLLSGACGRLLSVHLEGHSSSAAALQALARVLEARGIQSDLLVQPELDLPAGSKAG